MPASRGTVVIDPTNPHDFDEGELEAFAADLEEAVGDDIDVAVFRREEIGYGGPLMEVVHVFLDVKGTVDTAVFVASGVKWLKRRWDRDRAVHPSPARPRARVFNLYDENECLIRRVVIDLPTGDAMDDAAELGSKAPHTRPEPASP